MDQQAVCNGRFQPSWVQAHIEAFSFFAAVPSRVVLDNLKSAVLKADVYDPRFNRTYEELAKHYGFIIDPARARQPREKPW
jgi:transposase